MTIRRHPIAPSRASNRLDDIPLDQELIARLGSSFRLVAVRELELARLFYEKLFAARPDLRSLFPADIAPQARKLMASLEAVIINLEKPRENARLLASLGARHAGYGAQPGDYPVVIELLVEALRDLPGLVLSSSHLDEWRTVLHLVSNQMIAASQPNK
jgi:hemoglobin-like flavoprotein